MATRLSFSGSEFQVNLRENEIGGNGVLGDQDFPSATTLIDGRFVIAYQSPFNGNNAEIDVVARFLNSTPGYFLTYGFVGQQTQPAVAGRADGGFGIAFTNAQHANGSADANGTNITFRKILATGSQGAFFAIGDFNGGAGHDNLINPAIATLSTGRQVVVFENVFTANDHDIYLNVVDAAGTATQFTAASPLIVAANGAWQGSPAVAADNNNQALVVFEDGTLAGTATIDIRARLFDGASNTLGAAFTIADHATGLLLPRVASLADNRYVIVYGDFRDVWGRIYDPSTPGGAFLSDEFQIDTPGGADRAPQVATTVDGGFIVTWQHVVDSSTDIFVRRFDAHGVSYGDEFRVNTLIDGEQTVPTLATSGIDVVIDWRDRGPRATDASGTGIRGQFFTTTAFDYDSAGIGDLDNNGRADILFQNDTGDVAVWQTNGNGAVFSINSLGQRPAGYLIDGTGNFNSTPGDDILLRSSGGTLAIWPTAGIAAGAPVVIGNAPNTYHNSGIGDFTGDGSDDLLFRNDAGEIVTWAIANNGLAAAPQVLGATSLAYHIVGIDDFTGDDQSDILFRNDDGSVAVWQVANNQLLSATLVGSTSTAYHVVSTGDFDGNGAKDILFRGDNGELVEWLLDSTGGLLMSPTSIGTVGAQYHVDGSGDLNGDGRDDIIFREANGTVVEWLMNGTSFAAPPAVMGTIAVDYAIAAHHFDVV